MYLERTELMTTVASKQREIDELVVQVKLLNNNLTEKSKQLEREKKKTEVIQKRLNSWVSLANGYFRWVSLKYM